jgi:hypothetical protein
MRLTGHAHGGGCACKIPPGELEEAVRGLTGQSGDHVLVGLDDGDDAAAVLVRDEPRGAGDGGLLHPRRRRRLRLGSYRRRQHAVGRVRDGWASGGRDQPRRLAARGASAGADDRGAARWAGAGGRGVGGHRRRQLRAARPSIQDVLGVRGGRCHRPDRGAGHRGCARSAARRLHLRRHPLQPRLGPAASASRAASPSRTCCCSPTRKPQAACSSSANCPVIRSSGTPWPAAASRCADARSFRRKQRFGVGARSVSPLRLSVATR